jgi:hypothetical protein
MRGKAETKVPTKYNLPIETSASIVYHPQYRRTISIITQEPNWQWLTLTA